MERLYRVRTPEMVDFTFPVAGLASRFLAWLVDACVMALFGGAVIFVLGLVGCVVTAAAPMLGMPFMAFIILFVLALNWGYFFAWEALRDGRTPGKKALGLRTIGDNGVRITVAQAGIRNLLRAIDWMPGAYLLGIVSHAVASTGQRLGDLVAGTVVVREEKRDVPKRIGFPEAKYNSFLEDPTVATRINRAIKADEREVLLELLLRRDELELATRTELFQTLARHFAEKLDLPNAKFLSDEKVVMNLAQVVVETERRRVLTSDAVLTAPQRGGQG